MNPEEIEWDRRIIQSHFPIEKKKYSAYLLDKEIEKYLNSKISKKRKRDNLKN